MMERKLNVFIGYAPKDEEHCQELATFIKPLPINAWHEGKIMAGKVMDMEVKNHLQQADIILLLLSADFLANENNIYDEVLIAAQQRHNDGSVVVVPIILSYCLWKYSPFKDLKHLPADEKPVLRQGGDSHALFYEIAEALGGIIANFAPANKTVPSGLVANNQEKRITFGSHIHKLCDRDTQNASFRSDFMQKVNSTKNPHIFILYGAQNQRHHSLHDAFEVTTIKDIIERKYGLGESVTTHKKNTPILTLKDLQKSQEVFKANLSHALEVVDRIFQSGSEIAHCEGFQKYKMVLISHDISQKNWNKLVPDFLRWYINEFWNFVPIWQDIPQIIVLINVLWDNNAPAQTTNTLQKQLCKLETGNCTVLDELGNVTTGDVISWLNNYHLRDYYSSEELIQYVFSGKSDTNMGEVEDKLLKFLHKLK